MIRLISKLYSDYIFIPPEGVCYMSIRMDTGPFGQFPNGSERLVLITINICLITVNTCLTTPLTANWSLMTISNTPPWSICSFNLHVNVLVTTSISHLWIRWILKIDPWYFLEYHMGKIENIHRFLYWYCIVKSPMRKLIKNSCKIRRCSMMCEQD